MGFFTEVIKKETRTLPPSKQTTPLKKSKSFSNLLSKLNTKAPKLSLHQRNPTSSANSLPPDLSPVNDEQYFWLQTKDTQEKIDSIVHQVFNSFSGITELEQTSENDRILEEACGIEGFKVLDIESRSQALQLLAGRFSFRIFLWNVNFIYLQ